ncbi:enoyl-ACP reductase FabV [Clostridium mediterraneense]|uniref:enoyl-ACP reductase FabV n=1 Tax=Clostridium mediterraneense TaxID=1805472 RepID=UPI00083227AE|nr:enoyl-ACP reductase FabV [Clostridium mediterraneense]
MIVEPKFRGFICTTAHPSGCRENVKRQIDYVENKDSLNEIKNVLVIGAGAGYGLATSIVSGIACKANVLGLSFERESTEKRTGSAGFYNTKAVKEFFKERDLKYINMNGDAFSNEAKSEVIEKIKLDMGTIDLIVYSLAAPKRKMPGTDEVVNSYLKTTGEPLKSKTVDFHTGKITEVTIEPATQEEIDGTIKVMGGEDWLLWIQALKAENLLSDGVRTIAYSYIGPDVTEPIYREGTIGRAKKHLEATVSKIDDLLKDINGKSYVSVNKALVTQASSAIPIVSLYVSLLYKVMKKKGTHEGCIEQIYRMFSQLYGNEELNLDSEGRIRLDNFEMEEDIQEKIKDIWPLLNSETVFELTDVEGFRDEFFKLFGFGFANIDYKKDVEI